MNMFCFVLWMLGYPLVCSIGSYLSYLSGEKILCSGDWNCIIDYNCYMVLCWFVDME